VPVFDVQMTDVLPGMEPVPVTPPAQPIEGDSHAHLIAPLLELAREIGYRVQVRELPDDPAGGWCDPKRHEIVVAIDKVEDWLESERGGRAIADADVVFACPIAICIASL
jgi:hypothetical protein